MTLPISLRDESAITSGNYVGFTWKIMRSTQKKINPPIRLATAAAIQSSGVPNSEGECLKKATIGARISIFVGSIDVS